MNIVAPESLDLIYQNLQRYNSSIVLFRRLATFKEYYSDNEHGTKLLYYAVRKPKPNHINP